MIRQERRDLSWLPLGWRGSWVMKKIEQIVLRSKTERARMELLIADDCNWRTCGLPEQRPLRCYGPEKCGISPYRHKRELAVRADHRGK